jgi:hypothetical protein
MECALGLADGLAGQVYTAMVERDLIDGESGAISSWEKRQPKREREDNSAERVKALRERKRHVTPSNASDSQETPRGEEIREEVTPPLPPAGGNRSCTFKAFLAHCESENEKPVSGYAALWEYVDGIKLPRDFVQLAWGEFKAYYLEDPKGIRRRNIDWRLTFLNSVKDVRARLWYADANGNYLLTTRGLQAQAAAKEGN